MGTPNPGTVSTKLQRIATLAKEDPERALITLQHHIDIDFLREAYRRTRKDGAAGVGGQTAEQYAANLEENLEDLLNRFKSKTYYAPPVKRVQIPKADGKLRPLGIPTFEDKVLQRAVAMVVGEVWETNFVSTSYAFRPGKSAKQALHVLREKLFELKGGWVLDVDVSAYFDNIDHSKLREILRQRVRDGVINRTIDCWLNAGVLEAGQLTRPGKGTPQGGVISPLLANIYLHEVLDKWFIEEVQPRLRGRSFHVRFADDFVLLFECEEDARRVLEVLPKRFGKYSLTVHPEKTKLVYFNRPLLNSKGKGHDSQGRRPGSFDFLGFTHFWGRTRQKTWVVKQQTAKSRFQRSLKAMTAWCRAHRHWPIPVQHRKLSLKLRGYYNYFGQRGNRRATWAYYEQVKSTWRKWLSRRSQRHALKWEAFASYLKRNPLPLPNS